MTFFWCLRVYNRKCSQHGDQVCLAPLRSRWAGLVGRRCCDSAGSIKAICGTAHHPSLGLCLQWATTHALTPVWGARACPPSRQSSFYTKNMSSRTDRGSPLLLFPPCDRCVTMETGLLHLHSFETFMPLQSYSVCYCNVDFLQASVSNICLPAHSEKYSCSTLL